MPTATKTLANLATVVFESEEAAKAAAAAQAAAEAARVKADQARQRAEERRAEAYRAYLDKITAEHPAARSAALTTLSESHDALEQAVRSGDGVFRAYQTWVDASTRLWEVDAELAHIRYHHGQPARETTAPVFSFSHDVGAIIDRIAAEIQEDAQQRITARRTAFVSGRIA